ncbi:MAG: hypothetical protein HOE53_00110 [Candidatus Magasanikbacteria bacterium]|jgi:hypothetical protein|nr:hypothetical protein [Candidatus Magasanikbacteria bacterium]
MPRAKTKTKVKVNTKTKAIAITGIALAAAGAAYAGFAMRNNGYSTFSVECHDGSWMNWNAQVQEMGYRGEDAYSAFPGIECRTPNAVKTGARIFCMDKQNPETGKTGINSWSMSGKCQMNQNRYRDGYRNGYRFGYNVGYQGQAVEEAPQEKKSVFKKPSFLKKSYYTKKK